VVFGAVKTPRRSANGMVLGFHSSRRASIHVEWSAYMHGINQESIETPRTTLMTIAASLPCWLSLRPTPYPALPSLMPPAEQRNTVSLTFSKNIEKISCATSGENPEAEYEDFAPARRESGNGDHLDRVERWTSRRVQLWFVEKKKMRGDSQAAMKTDPDRVSVTRVAGASIAC
jgi:hypothetical protein